MQLCDPRAFPGLRRHLAGREHSLPAPTRSQGHPPHAACRRAASAALTTAGRTDPTQLGAGDLARVAGAIRGQCGANRTGWATGRVRHPRSRSTGRLLGEEGHGIHQLIRHMTHHIRMDFGVASTGITRRALTLAGRHVRPRNAFGRRIADLPQLTNALAGLALEIGRLLVTAPPDLTPVSSLVYALRERYITDLPGGGLVCKPSCRRPDLKAKGNSAGSAG